MTHYADHPGFNPGGIKDKIDNRDLLWSDIGQAFSPFDWNKPFDIEVQLASILNNPTFKIPVEDQNGSGSCGGQAWRYQGEVLPAIFGKPFERKSAKFIYAQTYYANGGGSTGRDNSNILVKQGICSESLLTSYDHGQAPSEAFMERPQDITDEMRLNARQDMALSYANVNADIDSIAQSIQANHGTILGVSGENNGTWTSAFPKPPSQAVWGHWLFAGKAKLINGSKFIGVLNSWGTGVGESGWQWLGEDYFKSGFIWQGWTHVYNPNPIVKGFAHLFVSEMGAGALTSGPEIVKLQQALQVEGCFPASVPTFPNFGPTTLGAVKKFQTKYGIPPTGYVGPKTLDKLNSLFA